MFFSKEKQELDKILSFMKKTAAAHNQRSIRSNFTSLSKVPTTNVVQATMVSNPLTPNKTLNGIMISLEKIENEMIFLDMSFTPLITTTELWDKNKKELVGNLTDKINLFQKPFDKIRLFKSPDNDISISPAHARVHPEFGLQFYTKYTYKNFNGRELWGNLASVCQLGDNCANTIIEQYL